MDTLFWLQVLIAFSIGGFAVAGLLSLSEKLPSSVSGLVLTIPTNMAIGLFFVGLTSSPEAVAQNTLALPFTLLGAVLYVLAYVCFNLWLTKKIPHRNARIALALLAANLVWFAAPVIIYFSELPPLWIGLSFFITGIVITQYIFNQLAHQRELPNKSIKFSFKSLVIRSLLSGTVIAVAVIISKTMGPFWGVIVGSCYPAAYTAQMLILDLAHGTRKTISILRKLPIGTIGQMFYILCVGYTYARFDLWSATLVSYVAWGIIYPIIIVSFGYVFYLILRDRLPKWIMIPFVINAASNLLFSPIQFTLQNNVLALIDILIVVGSLIWAMIAIWPHKKWVTFAQIPYLLWGTFATILQISITYLNW